MIQAVLKIRCRPQILKAKCKINIFNVSNSSFAKIVIYYHYCVKPRQMFGLKSCFSLCPSCGFRTPHI